MTANERQAIKSLEAVHAAKMAAAQRTPTDVLNHAATVAKAEGWTRTDDTRLTGKR